MNSTWLCTYYDGNEVRAGLVVNVSRDDLGDHLTLLSEARDWDIWSAVELHHDQLDSNNVDWVAKVLVEGHGLISIRDLPVLE